MYGWAAEAEEFGGGNQEIGPSVDQQAHQEIDEN